MDTQDFLQTTVVSYLYLPVVHVELEQASKSCAQSPFNTILRWAVVHVQLIWMISTQKRVEPLPEWL